MERIPSRYLPDDEKAMPFHWTQTDGQLREAIGWDCAAPRAILACLHGMSGAAEQFAPLVAGLPEIAVIATDLRGQGNDPIIARRGIRLDIEAQESDIAAFLSAVRQCHPNLPIFLMGESMGALLTARFASRYPGAGLEGVILSVPVVALKRPVPKPVAQIVRVIGTLAPQLRCIPSVFVNGKTKSLPLTRDKAYQDAIRTKPHFIEAFTFRFLSELGDLIEASDEIASRIQTPSLTLAAGKDCFVAEEQIRAWHGRIPGNKKTLSIYPEAFHLLWHDWDRDQVLGDIREWITATIGRLDDNAIDMSPE